MTQKLPIYEGIAYVGVTDLNEDKDKAQKLEFSNIDVILYPDNENPGKLYDKKITILHFLIYIFINSNST